MALDVREYAEGLGCAPLGELVGSPSEREASLVIDYRSRGFVRILGFKPPLTQPGDFRTQRSASTATAVISDIVLTGGHISYHLFSFCFFSSCNDTFHKVEFYTCPTPPEVNRGRPSMMEAQEWSIQSPSCDNQWL